MRRRTEHDHLTPGEVARVLGVGATTVRRLCDRGLLKYHRLPGCRQRRITRRSVQSLADTVGIPCNWDRIEPKGDAK